VAVVFSTGEPSRRKSASAGATCISARAFGAKTLRARELWKPENVPATGRPLYGHRSGTGVVLLRVLRSFPRADLPEQAASLRGVISHGAPGSSDRFPPGLDGERIIASTLPEALRRRRVQPRRDPRGIVQRRGRPTDTNSSQRAFPNPDIDMGTSAKLCWSLLAKRRRVRILAMQSTIGTVAAES